MDCSKIVISSRRQHLLYLGKAAVDDVIVDHEVGVLGFSDCSVDDYGTRRRIHFIVFFNLTVIIYDDLGIGSSLGLIPDLKEDGILGDITSGYRLIEVIFAVSRTEDDTYSHQCEENERCGEEHESSFGKQI